MARLGVGSMVTNYGRPRTLKWRDSIFDNQTRQPAARAANARFAQRLPLAMMTDPRRDLVNVTTIK